MSEAEGAKRKGGREGGREAANERPPKRGERGVRDEENAAEERRDSSSSFVSPLTRS